MPALKNAQQEKFCQNLAEGMTRIEAHERAGYRPHGGNASQLAKSKKVQARLAELQAENAERVGVTVEGLTDQYQDAYKLAMATKQPAAAVSATTAIGKLHGLFSENVQVTGKNGGPIQSESTLDVSRLSNEQLAVIASIRVAEEE